MGCFLIKEPPILKIDVVYVYPMNGNPQWDGYASRFISSYQSAAPCMVHNTIVVCNGGAPTAKEANLFAPLPNLVFLTHDNSGWDIGAFQKASRNSTADMIVFFGSSAYVQGAGWLARMAEPFVKNPEIQYGSMGNRGDMKIKIYPHIRTTGFWMQPALFNSYPHAITTPAQRFPFEHGSNCFTEFLERNGVKSNVVTWRGEYAWENWDVDPTGFNRGDQSSLLSKDRICDYPYYPRQ
jgi:hypothetical protein